MGVKFGRPIKIPNRFGKISEKNQGGWDYLTHTVVTSTVNTQIGTSGDFRTLAIRYHSRGATVYHRR